MKINSFLLTFSIMKVVDVITSFGKIRLQYLISVTLDSSKIAHLILREIWNHSPFFHFEPSESLLKKKSTLVVEQMSALYNQTNISPGTSQFITRAEVINALSSFAGDLSGADLSTLFYNPNPKFSTISMPTTGLISIPGTVQSLQLAVSTVAGFQAQDFNGFGLQNVCVAKGGVTTDIYAKNFIADNTSAAIPTSTNRLLYSYQGITGINLNQQSSDFLKWNPLTNTNPWYLTNVSSINGAAPNAQLTTFTTLTGSNLVSQIVQAPQVLGVSSLNGAPYAASVSGTQVGLGGSQTLPNGTAVLCYSITVPAGTFPPNTNFFFDVPVFVGGLPPNAPTGYNLMLGARLTNQGQINYQTIVPINVSAQNFTYQLTGIANTGNSGGSQVIQIWAVQNSGQSVTVPIQSPTVGPGTGWTVKALG